MARRPRDSDDDISLFPFLSIIASVIGVLTMMIATLALAQTDTPDVAMIEEYEQTQKKLAAADEAVEELRREISVSNSAVLKLQEQKSTLKLTVAELEKLMEELEAIEKELAEQKEIEVVIPPVDEKARETAADMQSQADSLKEELAALETELATRTGQTEANVKILPMGSGIDFQPQFVECAADSIVMHSLNPAKRIRSAEIAKDPAFLKLLTQVANDADQTITFLVRSDGTSTYEACRRICDTREIKNGKLPVVGQGRIDLSEFVQD